MDRFLDRGGARFVRFAVDEAAPDSGTCEHGGIAIGPVVASVGAVAVAGGADTSLGASTEFAYGYDHRVFKHATLVEVFDQGG